ncbi:serine/threonine-protein phosphatase [Cellulomonas sp. DKR-3]|uniref:Serine/threonine-protein phosphatase n=1 Tax=Cellulomonas fulva TaxID=2835530 RepID=A0ABS5TWH9_9CELL|nr:PP2C family serine/threonine-protein phosphatase [Cellulomonas fulva]MBT0993457.1 serine/threonine-protein phosphatase [Cellulomonas fulva]
MGVALRYAARSDVGLVRTNNQDSAYAGPHLLVVADGMGGHAGGDVASSLAIATFAPLDDEALGPDDALGELEHAIEDARDDIRARSAAEPDLAGMGTTVTAILRTGNKLAMVHLGDSRGYLMRDGVLAQVTTDHTFVQHLVDIGRITPEEAEHHPQRSVVMRVLGDFETDLTPDMSVREARPGDRWLLCSDGLSGFVSAETIETTMRELTDVDACADRLVQLALRGGGGDNVTVVLADVVELDELPDGSAPGTSPQVVGAAATTRDDPTVAADGPAARAAGLAAAAARAQRSGLAGSAGDEPAPEPGTVPDETAARARDGDEREDDELEDDEEAGTRRSRGALVAVLVAVLAVALVGGAAAWTRTQYYVGIDGDEVAIFQGVPGTIGPLSLSTVVERTGITTDEIESQYVRDRLGQSIHADDREAARRLVDELVATDPTDDPTDDPTPEPTLEPTAPATGQPTVRPTVRPTVDPTTRATTRPTPRTTRSAAGTDG